MIATLAWLVLTAVVSGPGVVVSERADPPAGRRIDVSNELYTLTWRLAPERFPHIESVRVSGGGHDLAREVQAFDSGRVRSCTWTLTDRGPLRAAYRFQLDVASRSSGIPDHQLTIEAVHYQADPRVVLRYRFQFAGAPTSWIPVWSSICPGGDVTDQDRFAGQSGAEVQRGLLPPIPEGPVSDGKRTFFLQDGRWAEVYDPQPGPGEGFGLITSSIKLEHFFYEGAKRYAAARRLWHYFRVNSQRQGIYEQPVTLVIAGRPAEGDAGQTLTERIDRRFYADGRPNGLALEPIRWRAEADHLVGTLEVIEEAGLERRLLPVELRLAGLQAAEWAEVRASCGPEAVPSQASPDVGGVVLQLPKLAAHAAAEVTLRLPARADRLARLQHQPGGGVYHPVLDRPAEPDPTAAFQVALADGVPRRNFARGEPIAVTWTGRGAASGEAFWAAVCHGTQTVLRGTESQRSQADGLTVVRLAVPARYLNAGAYRLLVSRGPGAEATPLVFRVRVCAPGAYEYPLGIWGVAPRTPEEVDRVLTDCRDHQVSHLCGGGTAYFWDQCTYYGLRCSVRPDEFYNIALAEAHPEVRQKLPDGRDTPLHTAPGRPTPCQGHPLQRRAAAQAMKDQLAAVVRYPALGREVFCSDDVQLYDWSCYNRHCTDRFRALTGLEAPLPPTAEQATRRKGVVAERDPWLLWNLFRSGDVFGGYNRAIAEAQKAAFPRGLLGPITGPLQRPVMYASAGLNPADGQKPFGFLCYYYYPHYLWPMASNIYYSELVRIGTHDDRPVWTVGQACAPVQDGLHVRSAFYTLLAAGNAGMSFYCYDELEPETWQEFSRLGTVARRFGKLFLHLKRGPKRVALLVPFTAAIYDNEYPHARGQAAFINLLGAHADVEPIGEEDLLAGRAQSYKAIVLADVDWLRSGAHGKLLEYMRSGGRVCLDRDTEVSLAGAIRWDFPLSRAAAPASADRPWTVAYLAPETVQAARRALAAVLPPRVEADSPELVLRPFVADGVAYLWAVNLIPPAHYDYLFRNCQFWRGQGQWIGRPKLLAYLRQAGLVDGRFKTRVRWFGEGVPYDVLAGRRLPTQSLDKGVEFEVEMQRLAGTLIALYPQEIAGVKVECPATAAAGADIEIGVVVAGADGSPVAGAQCLEVTIQGPDGSVGNASGPYLAVGGKARLSIPVAINDAPGSYTAEVRELASGKTARATWTLLAR